MKLNRDNLIGVIIGFIVLVIFAICLSSGCAKRITPVPEIRYVPVTDSTAVNELVLTKELLRRTQDSLNAYKSDTTISADYLLLNINLSVLDIIMILPEKETISNFLEVGFVELLKNKVLCILLIVEKY